MQARLAEALMRPIPHTGAAAVTTTAAASRGASASASAAAAAAGGSKKPTANALMHSRDSAQIKVLNVLLQDLAAANETDALIRVWDVLGNSKLCDPTTWQALETLHSKKGKVPTGKLTVPAAPGRTLQPARRLHKICKGRRLSARSTAAGHSLDGAVQWLAAERLKGRKTFLGGIGGGGGKGRRLLAAELQAALGIDKETARGLVTKLKQKKMLPDG
jgi:hypothetical protein